MKNNGTLNNNRLIRKAVVRMFPANFAATLVGSMNLMVDSLLAGALINQLAIAAVAVGNPVTGVFRALIQAISNGAAVQLTISIGRGNKEESNRAYSLGVIGSTLLGLFFVLLTLLTADILVKFFGGAGNADIAWQAALYLRACVPMILGSALNIYFAKVLSIYGYQSETFLIALCGAVLNLAFSILFVKILPADYAIAGLGLGTCVASLSQVALFLVLIRIRRLPLKFHFTFFKGKELFQIAKLGFPSSSNNLVDGVAAGMINNIILAGFGGDTAALSVYTVVKSVFSFALAAPWGAEMSSAPMFGLLYGARDKNGIKRTLSESAKSGLLFSAIWGGALLALLPLLLNFYGMGAGSPLSSIARTGVYTVMPFLAIVLLLRLMTTMFESTERFGMSLLYAIIPDSVIFPLMLLALMPVLGYTGVWIAYGANGIVFLLLLYLVRSLKNKSFRMSWDRLLCLDESVRDNVPKLDISITPTTAIAGALSEKVHAFMLKSDCPGRTAYMTALCLEELAADFIARDNAAQKSGEIMDIKLFSDDKRVRIIMRNAAKPYNPLDFDLDDETFSKVGVKMVQKVAQRIDYTYVLKMNIITIDIGK